jgi:hypothetical protein
MLSESDLSGFTGTENYYRWSILARNCLLTDGAKFLAEKGGAFWFMDIIASILAKIKPHGFCVCKITKNKTGSGAVFTADDGNGNVFYRQVIKYTDAPFDFRVFATWDETNLVIMLPSEY